MPSTNTRELHQQRKQLAQCVREPRDSAAGSAPLAVRTRAPRRGRTGAAQAGREALPWPHQDKLPRHVRAGATEHLAAGRSRKSGPPAELNRPRAGELPKRVRREAVRVGRRRSPHGRACVRSTSASGRELPNSPVSESREGRKEGSHLSCVG